MTTLSRWLAPTALAVALGLGAMAPAPVHAQDALTRVLVNIADVVFNNGTPYYRDGNNSYDDRLIVQRDRYGNPVYYRQVADNYNRSNTGYNDPRYGRFGGQIYDRYGRRMYDQYGRRINYPRHDQRHSQPYGNAYGYYGDTHCNKHGKCKHHDRGSDHDHDHDRDDDRDRDRDWNDDHDDGDD